MVPQVLLALLLVLPGQGNTAPTKPKKPNVKLSCSPAIANVRMFEPAEVIATVRIANPGERLWCPSVHWTIELADGGFRGMGTIVYRGTHESDCLPYEQELAEEGNVDLWAESKHFGLYSGIYVISADLFKDEKRVASDNCVVTIR